MAERTYCVYILTNANNAVLYTGVTNDLQRRIFEHRSGKGGRFSQKYHLTKLVYFEYGDDAQAAITREKQIEGGSRQRKIDLINSMNPGCVDLYDEYFG
jgi:putative endonuclease